MSVIGPWHKTLPMKARKPTKPVHKALWRNSSYIRCVGISVVSTLRSTDDDALVTCPDCLQLMAQDVVRHLTKNLSDAL